MKTLYKSLTWRFIAFSVTSTLVYLKTGSLAAAGAIGLVDSLIKIVAFIVHEKMWESKFRARFWKHVSVIAMSTAERETLREYERV